MDIRSLLQFFMMGPKILNKTMTNLFFNPNVVLNAKGLASRARGFATTKALNPFMAQSLIFKQSSLFSTFSLSVNNNSSFTDVKLTLS
jgi:hypothetical protein